MPEIFNTLKKKGLVFLWEEHWYFGHIIMVWRMIGVIGYYWSRACRNKKQQCIQ